MFVFRIVHKSFTTLAASGLEGRWNGAGRKVIYAGATIEIAFMENMIRRQGVGFNEDFRTMILRIPETLKLSKLEIKDLPAGWREFRDYSKCQFFGNRWYDEGKTPVLKVPSAVIPESSNYVLNAIHPHFKKIKIEGIAKLVPDQRIEDILKKYPH